MAGAAGREPLLRSEIHGFSTYADLNVEKLKSEAAERWFRPNEIYAVLANHEMFKVHATTIDKPVSGIFVLYDRKIVPNFRKDGHDWKKKKDGRTVEEPHERLKIGSEERVHVYYARGEHNPNFFRRCYWLLDKEADGIVFVHYRQTFEEIGIGHLTAEAEAEMHTEVPTMGSKSHLPLQYLKDITNNFCSERIIAKGGFGVVYKGLLESGEMVAVKKLLHAIPSSQKQFENEVNLLMKLEHPNIVRLVGYCYQTQHIYTPHEGKSVFVWDTESLLCLEFLPNGSLDYYISDASSGLDWHTRCKIIEGISYGLQYLHEHSSEPIVHLDLKPANILLDANMLPKITDFGLSRLFDQTKSIHTAITSGTLGYMPPEFLRGIITPMSDIFSLGVIIMEVITGHRDYPYDIRKSSKSFIELELQKWRNRLQKEPRYTSLEIDCQQIERCIQIGLICVNPERAKRPTMKKVIDMLLGQESMDWCISNELSSHGIQDEPWFSEGDSHN